MDRHLSGVADCDLGLELADFDVDSSRANHAREVAFVDLFRIDQNKVANAKSRQVFGYQ